MLNDAVFYPTVHFVFPTSVMQWSVHCCGHTAIVTNRESWNKLGQFICRKFAVFFRQLSNLWLDRRYLWHAQGEKNRVYVLVGNLK